MITLHVHTHFQVLPLFTYLTQFLKNMLRSDLSTAMNGCQLSRSQLAEAMIQENAETLANSLATHVLRNTTIVKEQDKFLVIHDNNHNKNYTLDI